MGGFAQPRPQPPANRVAGTYRFGDSTRLPGILRRPPTTTQHARGRSRILTLEQASANPDPTRRVIIPGEENADSTRRIIVPGAPVRDRTRTIIRPGTPARTPPTNTLRIVPLARLTPTGIARILAEDGDPRQLADFCHRAGLSGGPCPGGAATAFTDTRGFRGRALSLSHRTMLGPLRREVRDAHGRSRDIYRRSTVVRTEFDRPNQDPIVNEAFDKAGTVLAFFRTVLGRQGFDGNGGRTTSIVHVGQQEDNAFFDNENGPAHIAYGDGDGESRPMTSSNFPYHEIGHGVVDSTARLVYAGESGALHEHFADVFAVTIDQWERAETAEEADFSIGRGSSFITSPLPPTRRMGDPRADGMPGHIREARTYAPTDDDGGVHTLVGVPNRAFYVAARRLGGHIWNHVGLIWYAALRDRIGPRETFRGTAQATVDTALELFGAGSPEVRAVQAGWNDVGIRTRERVPPPALRGMPNVRLTDN